MNVLLYAHRADAERHDEYRTWLETELDADRHYGVSDLVLSSVLRIATHQRIFMPPTPLADAIAFCEDVRERPNAVPVTPGPRHWRIFTTLCAGAGARGNLVPDAYLAALAIESGSEWITTDRGYARFPGLRVRHPLDG